jgi:hypothetical protein
MYNTDIISSKSNLSLDYNMKSIYSKHGNVLPKNKMAPQVGFEPTTPRLTAECSTVELLRNFEFRQRPTLPEGLPSSTIGAEGLNFCVRNGYRCFPFAIVTGIYSFRCRIPHPEACSFFCFFYYAYPAAFPAVSFASSSDSLMYCIH